jgi:ParB family chromosome partitioning protein
LKKNARAKDGDEDLGDMLQEAYETGPLRGHQVTEAKRLLEKRKSQAPKSTGARSQLPASAHSLANIY